MFRNYFKTALRSLLKHRFFSAINIFGLAVAMALSMVIIMLVADQMMYDRYNTKHDRVYRINSIRLAENGAVDLTTIVVGVFMLIIFGTITIGSQTWRTTFIKPVDNLKND